MKRRTVIVVLLANLTAVVLLAVFVPHLMVSPGRLTDAHAELASDCFACHSPFVGSTPRRCIACHQVAEIGLKTTNGVDIAKEKKQVAFHQKLVQEDCVACHSEHRGVQAFRPIREFSHRLLQPAVQDQCDGCHGKPGDALHRKIKGNCGQCHTQEAWLPATFDHEQYFRFDRHHTTDCETCHVGSDYSNYTCYGCHEHSRAKIRSEHYEEGIYDYENCVECHRSGDEDEAERRMRSRAGGGGEPSRGRRRGHDDD